MDVKLVMFKANGARKDFPVTKDVAVIGRGENCDLRIPLEEVSRRHCEIRVVGEKPKVKDLASSNGTYVNNKRINEAALQAGDRLVVGPIVFTVQIDGVPEEIAPAKTRAERAAASSAPPGGEEIVELEADVAEIDDDDVFAAVASDEDSEVDPIAALEALAAEGQKTKKKPNG
ncbi:MAG TPA: FHA domain-containing protein [Phycisphaerae bacterium]|nr:FHA domain-containing protein [Phycisphaerae bacterium]